jgi:hypothetical protein
MKVCIGCRKRSTHLKAARWRLVSEICTMAALSEVKELHSLVESTESHVHCVHSRSITSTRMALSQGGR